LPVKLAVFTVPLYSEFLTAGRAGIQTVDLVEKLPYAANTLVVFRNWTKAEEPWQRSRLIHITDYIQVIDITDAHPASKFKLCIFGDGSV
jgi:hypothetical protein